MSDNDVTEMPEEEDRHSALPISQRPASTAPGHWVLARVGKRVLRPGGLELTLQMLSDAKLTGSRVVEYAPGLGRTASEILAARPASYTGVDKDPVAAKHVRELVGTRGTVINADAADTGLESGSADVVVGEAMLTMQGEKSKKAIISEAVRLLAPGGRYAIHELAVQPDSIDEELHTQIRKDLARAIHVNARPLTCAQWSQLLEECGLMVDSVHTAPMALLDFSRNIRDEGFLQTLRIIRNVLSDRELRERVLGMRKTFRTYQQWMCGVTIVARKPLEGNTNDAQ